MPSPQLTSLTAALAASSAFAASMLAAPHPSTWHRVSGFGGDSNVRVESAPIELNRPTSFHLHVAPCEGVAGSRATCFVAVSR